MNFGMVLHRVASAWKGHAVGDMVYCVMGDLRFLSEAKLNNFWQLVVDEKKQIFTSEKFLLLASEDGEFLGP